MEKLNIAEILKDCPSGMELDCTLFEGLEFDCIVDNEYLPIRRRIKHPNGGYTVYNFTKYGCWLDTAFAKCVIFPKGKTTWEGFQRPFKDGDIIFTHANCLNVGLGNTWISIFKENRNSGVATYVDYCNESKDYYTYLEDKSLLCEIKDILLQRFATEEEKQKLFDAIKENGYKWNHETKTLEKLSEFQAGDVLVSRTGIIALCSHIDDKQVVHYHCILGTFGDNLIIKNDIGIGKSFHCALATNTEKQRLFDKLKSAGYKYNPQTNKLEKLIVPKFKIGNVIQDEDGYKVKITEVNIEDECYSYESIIAKGIGGISFSEQDNWELVPAVPKFKVGDIIKQIGSQRIFIIKSIEFDRYILHNNQHIKFKDENIYELISNKFNITTLKPFESRVLVRNIGAWEPAFWGYYSKEYAYPFVVVGGYTFAQCIPYESNEHLLGTTNDCDEYYKTWE